MLFLFDVWKKAFLLMQFQNYSCCIYTATFVSHVHRNCLGLCLSYLDNSGRVWWECDIHKIFSFWKELKNYIYIYCLAIHPFIFTHISSLTCMRCVKVSTNWQSFCQSAPTQLHYRSNRLKPRLTFFFSTDANGHVCQLPNYLTVQHLML